MARTEKRNSLRNMREHTYCLIKDIEPQFDVIELSANGFSFSCDRGDARFRVEERLSDISILNGEAHEIIHATGKIRHRSHFDARRDRVGVSFETRSFDRTTTGRVRLPRHRPSVELRVTASYRESSAVGAVIDYNIRSARISLANAPARPIAGEKIRVVISSGSRELYAGAAQVIRVDNDGAVVVIDFLDNLLELRSISLTEKALFAKEIIDEGAERLAAFTSVSAEYRALVSDWRMYLEMVQDVFDKEESKGHLVSAEDERLYLEELVPGIFGQLRHFISDLNRIAPLIDQKNLATYKQLLRSRIEPFLLCSPLASSIMSSAHGYHGDFETVKQFFADSDRGSTLFGKLMNRFIMSLEPVTAHVNRIDFLYHEILDHYRRSENGIRVLSLGSGPAEEILRLLSQNNFDKPIHISLIDMDAHALADFYERSQSSMKRNVELELVNFNIIDVLVGKPIGLPPKSFDVTYCAGLFDYFKDRFCRKFVDFLIGLTKTDGFLYYTNVHSRNFARYFMDFGGGWEIYHRSEEETRRLAPPQMPAEVVTDVTGTNVFVKLQPGPVTAADGPIQPQRSSLSGAPT